MKNIRFLSAIFVVLYLSMPLINIMASGCDDLKAAVDAANKAVGEANKTLKDLEGQRDIKWVVTIGKALGADKDFNDRSLAKDPTDMADKLEDAASHVSLNNQIKAAEEALQTAIIAYQNAFMAYGLCVMNYFSEEITGPCGHTYPK